MKINRKFSSIIFGFQVLVTTLSAQSIDGMVSDQIAAHFEQVFSPYSKTGAEYRDNWLPGDDAKPNLLNLEVEVSADVSFLGETGIKHSDQDARISFSKVVYSLTYPFKPGKKISLIVGDTELYLNEKNDKPHFFNFDKVSQLDAGLMYTTNISPKWDLFLGVGGVHSDGTGDTHNVSNNLLGFIGGSVTFTPNFTVSTGIRFSTNEAYYASTFPILMLEWRINDRNRLSIRDAVEYQYAITDDWRNVLILSTNSFNIFVEEKNQWIGDNYETDLSRTIEDNSLRIGYVHWFNNGLILSSSVGLLHSSVISLIKHDKDDVVLENELDSTIGLHVGLSMRF